MKNGMFEGEPERDFFGNFSVPFKLIGKLIVTTEEEIKAMVAEGSEFGEIEED